MLLLAHKALEALAFAFLAICAFRRIGRTIHDGYSEKNDSAPCHSPLARADGAGDPRALRVSKSPEDELGVSAIGMAMMFLVYNWCA